MQKNQLLKNQKNEIVRVLAVDGDEVLYISCNKGRKEMPKWASSLLFSGYLPCKEEELQQLWEIKIANEDEMEVQDRNIARCRYAVIAPVLTFLEDERLRAEAIGRTAEQNHITKQTVRNYLRRYLVFSSVSALVPKKRTAKEKPLSDDEKNIRWAVNKYYYSRKKNSLNFAYKMMLAKKYTDDEGRLLQKYPSFNQFRYWYSKNKKLLTYYISRNGMSDFMRNDRVLLGDNAQVFAAAPGTAMADSTVLDLYVVSDDRTQVIGRPVLSAVVDAYSYLCLGYSLSWEAGEFSLRDLMCNVIADKKEHCKKFGIEISENEWPNNKMPGIIITDRGADYVGHTYSQLAELSVHIQNLEGYRGDMKGQVEKFFDLCQNYFKPHLKGAGVVAPEYNQRGSYFGNYKESSCLTLKETETILLRCIIHYNTKHLIEHYPYTKEMLGMGVKPYANDIWKYGVENLRGCNLIDGVSQEKLILTLLPRTTGKFSRHGLKVNGMRYFCEGFIERCLQGGEAVVTFDKDDVSFVWLYEKGKYTRFELIESRFKDMDLLQVQGLKARQKELVESGRHESLQSDVELIGHIQTIKKNAVHDGKPKTKNMKDARKAAREEKHINHAKEAGLHD
ncbi:MAG: Mu transposase C-terminal domain-containing protein [Lachnospiraceae bacterium]